MGCFGPYSPSMSMAGKATVPCGSWTIATLMDRSPRCAATESESSSAILLDQDLVSGPVVEIATRDGLKVATALPDGRIRVTMGPAVVGSRSVVVTTADGAEFKALTADVGNPHAVSFVDDLDLLQLHAPPRWDPAEEFPDGVNLEFVRQLGPQHIAMRVYERGVGETHSCGTGTVAAAAAARVHDQDLTPLPVTYRVDTPGGSARGRADRAAGLPDRACGSGSAWRAGPAGTLSLRDSQPLRRRVGRPQPA